MNLTRARLIVRNPASYDPITIRTAAVWLLGSMSATDEDIHDASYALILIKR